MITKKILWQYMHVMHFIVFRITTNNLSLDFFSVLCLLFGDLDFLNFISIIYFVFLLVALAP